MLSGLNTARQNMQELIAELEQAGAVFRGNACKCPFHDDKRASAGIYADTDGIWRFKCHSCGAGGDLFDVRALVGGQPLSEILKATTGQIRRSNGEGKMTKPQAKVYKTIDELKKAVPGTVEAVYQYTDPGTGHPDMIVIRSKTADGKTFRQCRPCNGGFEMKAPPKPWPLYNRKRIQQADTVVVVEGEKVVHALHEYGVIATTSPAGAGKSEYADWQPLAGKNVILWPDNDELGRKHIRQVEAILEKLEPSPRISIIEPNDLDLQHKEDAADYADYIEQLKIAGADVRAGLQEALSRAKPKGVSAKLKEQFENIISGNYTAIELTWLTAHKLTKALLPGAVTLLCGSPGASKSFMLLQAAAYWLDNGVKFALYELEESREYHLQRALAQRAGIAKITDPDYIQQNPEQARNALSEHHEFIEALGRCLYACSDSQPTLDQIGDWAEQRAKAGCRIICIDPITAAAQSAKPWLEDSAFLQRIKRVATEHSCSFLLVTHPKKEVGAFPDMNALAGGAAYSRFSQTIFWLHSHNLKTSKVRQACGTIETEHNRTLHILKARNGRGQGLALACEFSKQDLTLNELGTISD